MCSPPEIQTFRDYRNSGPNVLPKFSYVFEHTHRKVMVIPCKASLERCSMLVLLTSSLKGIYAAHRAAWACVRGRLDMRAAAAWVL